MYYKSYNVILEYMSIKILSDNVDWGNRRIAVNSKCEHIVINIQRLEHKNANANANALPNLITYKPALDYEDIMKYWQLIEINFKNKLDIINSLVLNKHYIIAPYYITNDLVILGIVIFNTNINTQGKIEKIDTLCLDNLSRYNNYNVIETNNYLSTLKPLYHKKDYKDYKNYKDDKDDKDDNDKYIFNIIDGILEHRINSCGIIIFIGKELLKNKYININIKNNIAFSIKWEYIFRNIANYIPKLKLL